MIRVEGLSKWYGGVTALDDVSFLAGRGEVLGVLGLNGAGKSTLLRILAGEVNASAGRVEVGNVDMGDDPRAIRGRVGYLPEQIPLYLDMRALDFLTYMGRLNGVEPQALAARLREVAHLTHLTEHLHRVLGELSLGVQKRVGIACAILHQPEVVILDEPVSALDPAEIVGMRALIRSLGGTHTVLVSSHILSEVSETCDRLLVLHEGRLVGKGTEATLQADLGSTLRFTLQVRGVVAQVEQALPEGTVITGHQALGLGITDVFIEMQDDRRETLVAELVDLGVGVRALVERRSGLEELFLSVVDGARP
jgi:ABC-2 type transport system ATP-binding protein